MHSRLGRSSIWTVTAALVSAGLSAVGVASAGPAAAAQPPPVCDATTCTVTYGPGTTTWTVPPGVTQAAFKVSGAQGGSPSGTNSGTGGFGAGISGTVEVAAGQTIEIGVGGAGAPDGTGGFNGGGTATATGTSTPLVYGGGGGGYSTVIVDAAPVIVAGGGGGGGLGSEVAPGGDGGRSGEIGVSGENSGTDGNEVAVGGGGGTADAGGSGGHGNWTSGGSGSSWTGGGGPSGGAGGGGWYGGGQGGVTPGVSGGLGGGGGGGSSYVAPVVSGVSITSGAWQGDGRVVLEYDNPVSAGNVEYTAVSGHPLAVSAPGGALAAATGPTALTASLESTPAHGTVALNADGSFTYTSEAGFTGTDRFDYRATDTGGNYATGTVSITVNAAPADLEVDLTAAASRNILPKAEFTATVTNNGPGAAEATQLHMTYPKDLGQVQLDDPEACVVDSSARTIDCNLGDLPANDDGIRTVTFRAALLAIGQQTVNATVESVTTDPDVANNTDSASCTAVTAIIITC